MELKISVSEAVELIKYATFLKNNLFKKELFPQN